MQATPSAWPILSNEAHIPYAAMMPVCLERTGGKDEASRRGVFFDGLLSQPAHSTGNVWGHKCDHQHDGPDVPVLERIGFQHFRPQLALHSPPKSNSKTSVRLTHRHPTRMLHLEFVRSNHGANVAATMIMHAESSSPLRAMASGLFRLGRSTASRKIPFSMAGARINSQTPADLRISMLGRLRRCAAYKTTASSGRRTDRGSSSPRPKRTTRSGLPPPTPRKPANSGRIDETSTG